MGNYTGVHLQFPFKAGIPKEITGFMNDIILEDLEDNNHVLQGIFNIYKSAVPGQYIYGLEQFKEEPSVQGLKAELINTISQCSAYFPSWEQRLVEYRENGAMWVRTWSSVKEVPLFAIAALIAYMQSYLELKDGTVILRSLYEESSRERAIWFDDSAQNFLSGQGYKYFDEEENSYSSGMGWSHHDEEKDVDLEVPIGVPMNDNPRYEEDFSPLEFPIRNIRELHKTSKHHELLLKEAKIFCVFEPKA